jgi:nitrite reductase/ring-hydroxylating ferredoxin subunit
MSDQTVRVCSASDIPENSVRQFEIGDKTLAVYNIDGAYYATNDECTHGAASLADGFLDGDVIECNLHFGAFHVPTGKPVAQPCSIALRTYKVTVENDDILVDLNASAAA